MKRYVYMGTDEKTKFERVYDNDSNKAFLLDPKLLKQLQKEVSFKEFNNGVFEC